MVDFAEHVKANEPVYVKQSGTVGAHEARPDETVLIEIRVNAFIEPFAYVDTTYTHASWKHLTTDKQRGIIAEALRRWAGAHG